MGGNSRYVFSYVRYGTIAHNVAPQGIPMSQSKGSDQLHVMSAPHEQGAWPGGQDQHLGWNLHHHPHAWRPPTDVYETGESYVVLVEIAGMRGDEFNINFEKQILRIYGVRPEAGGLKAYNQMEIAYGEFVSEIRIPAQIVADGIEATYGDGFLRVVLPKVQPKQVPISSHD
jgi:HSP20 family protein